jgi:hypothetical protein
MLINARIQVAQGNQSSEDPAIFIRGELLCLDDLCLEGLGIIVIQAESYLEGTIRSPSLAFEEVDDLGKNFIEGHSSPSTALAFAVLYPLRCHTFALKGRAGCEATVSRNEGRDGRRGASIRR